MSAAQSTTDLLPFHLKPRPDETFTSWVLRLACANCLSVSRFVAQVSPASEVADFGRRAGVSIDRARQTLLDAPDEESAIPEEPRADNLWVVPVWSPKSSPTQPTRDFGHPYCPICLTEDETPYMRRLWLRSYVNVCHVHGVGLLDRCPRCEIPVDLRRADLSPPGARRRAPVTLCHGCGADLRSGIGLAREAPLEAGDLDRADLLINAVRTGWIELAGPLTVRSFLFFPVLSVLVRLAGMTLLRMDHLQLEYPWNELGLPRRMRQGPYVVRGPLLRDPMIAVLDHRLPEISAPPQAVIPYKRRRLLADALWLLEDWPERFLKACRREEIWDNTLLQGFDGSPPFWYWSVVSEHLVEPRVISTPQEATWKKRQVIEHRAWYRRYSKLCAEIGIKPVNYYAWWALGCPPGPEETSSRP